jgi:hypothetical protein
MHKDHGFIVEIENLIQVCCKYESIYIYGNAINQVLLKDLLIISGIKVSGFVVSNITDCEQKDVISVTMLNKIANNKTGLILGLSDIYYNSISSLIKDLKVDIIYLTETAKHLIANKLRPQNPEEMKLELNLVAHCNLNCAFCDHFSQLAERKFLSVSEYKKDIERFAFLSENQLGTLKLLGGEPLLNSHLVEFLEIGRSVFPNSKIELYTNGLLLLNRGNELLWKSFNQNLIDIVITRYPLGLDLSGLQIEAIKSKVNLEICNDVGDRSLAEQKQMIRSPLDPEKEQPIWNFIDCYKMNNCTVLDGGKLYICPTSAYIKHFNHYFNCNFDLIEGDYLDIYSIKSYKEMADFICRPIPFCKYCNMKESEFHKWRTSKKEFGEYVDLH